MFSGSNRNLKALSLITALFEMETDFSFMKLTRQNSVFAGDVNRRFSSQVLHDTTTS